MRTERRSLHLARWRDGGLVIRYMTSLLFLRRRGPLEALVTNLDSGCRLLRSPFSGLSILASSCQVNSQVAQLSSLKSSQ